MQTRGRQKYGLSADVSNAIWKHARKEAPDEGQAFERFEEVALRAQRVSAHVELDAGKVTPAQAEVIERELPLHVFDTLDAGKMPRVDFERRRQACSLGHVSPASHLRDEPNAAARREADARANARLYRALMERAFGTDCSDVQLKLGATTRWTSSSGMLGLY